MLSAHINQNFVIFNIFHMNFYSIIYTVSIVFWIYWGFLVYKFYKNSFWIFFFLSTIFMSLWFLLFFLFFIWIHDKDFLLIITKTCFAVWVFATYSLLFSLYSLKMWYNSISNRYKFLWILWAILLLWFYIFSDTIIQDLALTPLWIYREVPWNFFFIHFILQTLFILWFIAIAFLKVKNQSYINRLRLRFILISAYSLIFIIFVFQLILPALFHTWIWEKELIFFYLGFIFSILYVIKRYYFTSLYYSFWKIVVALFSIVWASFWVFGANLLYQGVSNGFWGELEHAMLYGNILLGILFYHGFSSIFSRIILGKYLFSPLNDSVRKIEQHISMLYSIEDVNKYLKTDFAHLFKTTFAQIQLFKSWEVSELRVFFQNDIQKNKIFINDFVFIQENKHKLNKEKLWHEINKNACFIFPLYNNENVIWIFMLGTKPFRDFYDNKEIKIIKNFTFFLEHHIKYLKSFDKIKELSIHLDKKVDEKTLEYNNLINKQKEFISILSHEIRSPIASAIFQWDSISDDLQEKNIDLEYIKSEINILNWLLIRVWDLTNKLFNVQYYDTQNITLYKEFINISQLLLDEFDILSHVHEYIEFTQNIDRNIWFIQIDKIQFTQVITNLLNNAIKFCNTDSWKIYIEAYKKENHLCISIHDNWKWIQWINLATIFEKFSTWNDKGIWLWLWLYLCKKIIWMHNGTISGNISQILWWAEFKISIPIE